MKKIILFFLFLYCSANDERLTKQRPGYGVNFSLCGRIMDTASITYYYHTWSILLPEFNMPEIASYDELYEYMPPIYKPICSSMLEMLYAAGSHVYESKEKNKKMIELALEAIPLVTNETSRQKRSTQEVKSVMQNFPHVQMANAVNNLFHIPTYKAIEDAKTRVLLLAEQRRLATSELIKLKTNLGERMIVTDKRLDELLNQQNLIHASIQHTRKNIEAFRDRFSDFHSNISQRIAYQNSFVDYILSTFLPLVSSIRSLSEQYNLLGESWIHDLESLVQGYAGPFLLTRDMLKFVIEHIQSKILRNPLYESLKLVSNDPLYYYQLQGAVSVSRTDRFLLLTIGIPLYNYFSEIPLYRIHSFPVPVAAGLSYDPNVVIDKEGYTEILDLPEYIAVSDDKQRFIELSENEKISSCTGVGRILFCSGLKNVVHLMYSTTCAFAIFMDNHADVKKHCQVVYSKTAPLGSAVQLQSDNSFLIHGGSDLSRKWMINCPEKAIGTDSQVSACNMCKISIPCLCSLTASQFIISKRITGCSFGDTNSSIVLYYHRNMFTMSEMLNRSDYEKIHSYTTSINKRYPPIEIVPLQLVDSFNQSNWAEKSKQSQIDYMAALGLQKKNVLTYMDKASEAARLAQDFSDQRIREPLDLLEALKHAITGVGSWIFGFIFGDTFVNIVTLICSLLGIGLISFILSLLQFCPICIRKVKWWRAEKRVEQMEEYSMIFF